MAYEKFTNLIRVKNTSVLTIPAYSFARLKQAYSSSLHYFEIEQPDADNLPLSEVVIVPEEIPPGKVHLAYTSGICIVAKTFGETIVAGDKVGTHANKWTATKIDDDSLGNNDGQFLVLDTYGVSNEYLIIRPRTRESLFALLS